MLLTHIAGILAIKGSGKSGAFEGCCLADCRVGRGRDACTATCYIERPVTSSSCTFTELSTSAGHRDAEPTTGAHLQEVRDSVAGRHHGRVLFCLCEVPVAHIIGVTADS